MNASQSPHQDRESSALNRRSFLAATSAAAATMATTRVARAFQEPQPPMRVAVIGHTGHGNYGHGLDRVWREVPQTKIVAVADADPAGLAKSVRGLGDPKGFADYRKMLEEVRPQIVAVAPRWLDQHHDMVLAAAECGAVGIYLEKPMCRTLAEADAMVAACEKHKVKLAIAHQTRYSPRLPVIEEIIRSGKLGRVIEIRARGKEDNRGGGEDLWVLGTHVLNLTNHFGGAPESCYGTVLVEGRPVGPDDVQPGAEGIGPLAGDEVHAMYRLGDGITGYFDSVRKAGGSPTRFGLRIFGSLGILDMGTGYLPPVHFLPDSGWAPGRTGTKWLPVTSAGIDKPEPLEDTGLHGGNLLAVKDLLAAIREDRQPVSNIDEARTAVEMIAAVFESHRQGRPVKLPLENRQNPLTMLG